MIVVSLRSSISENVSYRRRNLPSVVVGEGAGKKFKKFNKSSKMGHLS